MSNMLFYPAVILACLYGEGLSAILLSALAIQFFFIPSMYSLALSWPGDVIRLTLVAPSMSEGKNVYPSTSIDITEHSTLKT